MTPQAHRDGGDERAHRLLLTLMAFVAMTCTSQYSIRSRRKHQGPPPGRVQSRTCELLAVVGSAPAPAWTHRPTT